MKITNEAPWSHFHKVTSTHWQYKKEKWVQRFIPQRKTVTKYNVTVKTGLCYCSKKSWEVQSVYPYSYFWNFEDQALTEVTAPGFHRTLCRHKSEQGSCNYSPQNTEGDLWSIHPFSQLFSLSRNVAWNIMNSTMEKLLVFYLSKQLQRECKSDLLFHSKIPLEL